jgi:AcrR family transcriptional regulator
VTAPESPNRRAPLTKERVLDAAIELADRRGLGALTMRRLGAALGVEAMSLYKHVANKEALLAGMVDRVVGAIAIPEEGSHWRSAMAQRAASARAVLARHAWVIGLLEAGATPGPHAMRYLDAIIGSLRAAGFSMEDAGRAFMLLDSYVYGHVIQESNLPFAPPAEVAEAAGTASDQAALTAFPHLAALYAHARSHPRSLDDEFAFGLELVLDGLERLRSG